MEAMVSGLPGGELLTAEQFAGEPLLVTVGAQAHPNGLVATGLDLLPLGPKGGRLADARLAQ